MSENKEVTVTLFKHFDKWRFAISCGKYHIQGLGDTIEQTEEKANFALTAIPNKGIIHYVYEHGKPVELAKGSFFDSFVKD